MQHPHHQTKRYIDSLTGLRAVAAFWVLLFHSWNFFFYNYTDQFFIKIEEGVPLLVRTGYLGVDIFFVLSGFVMAINYWDDFVKERWTLYGRYVLNRIARIYPAYIVTFFLTSFLVFTRLSYVPESHISWSAFWSELPFVATMTHALFFTNIEEVLRQFWFANAVIWTLSFEWVAYLAFPLLVILFSKTRYALYALLISGLLLLFGMYLNLLSLSDTDQPALIAYAFFGWHGLLRIGSEFLLGMAGALMLRKVSRTMGWQSLVLLAAMGVLLYLQQELLFIALLPFFMVTVATGKHPLLSSPIMVYLGEISYSLYLLHLLLIHVITAYSVKHQSYIVNIPQLWVKIALYGAYIAAAILAAHLMYRYVEKPLRRVVRRLSSEY